MAIDTSLHLLDNRRTKIVATIGPATNSRESIDALIAAGVNIFRLNMSHGDHAGHKTVYDRIREAAHEAKKHIGVLADLCGPKIRVGIFETGELVLEPGQTVTVTTRPVTGRGMLIPSQYKDLHKDVQAGDRVLLADGVMELRVESVRDTEVECTVVHGGVLQDRKGINLPGVSVSAPALTEKDKDDARFALGLGVDFLAQSFVRKGSDIEQLKQLVQEIGESTFVIAKIERPEALTHAHDILDAAHGIMVARGDLGVELPPEEVPVAQRLLVDEARAKNKPVIVATQMLESMIDNSRPTRAEVADIANTVISGADAIMLSAETATGAHPVRAVEMMDRIARHSEGYLWSEGAFGSVTHEDDNEPPIPFGDAVARATSQLSRDLMVRAISVVTGSGMTATTVSSARPAAPILTISASEQTCRRMNLMWGVIPIYVDAAALNDPIELTRRLVREREMASPGQYILLVRGFSGQVEKNTPSITLLSV